MKGLSALNAEKKLFLIVSLLSINLVILGFQWNVKPVKAQIAASTTLFDSPYYITCEAKILGPTVDLAAIKSATGGIIYADYVEWLSGNMHFRVYVDNTMQTIIHGTLDQLIHKIKVEEPEVPGWSSEIEQPIEDNLISQFNRLSNEGALDLSSTLSEIVFKTRLLSGYWKWYSWRWFGSIDVVFDVSTTQFKIMRLAYYGAGGFRGVSLYLDEQEFMRVYYDYHPGYHIQAIRSDIPSYPYYTIRITGVGSSKYPQYTWLAIYTGDDATTTLAPTREYYYSKSPGTGLALKEVSPKTSYPNQIVDVTVAVDPPTAGEMDITDSYPTDFELVSSVTLKKYRGENLIESVTIDVTPQTVGTVKQFTIDHADALNILGSLDADEWLTMEYQLRTPSATGVYTLPAAQIQYTPLF